MRLLQDTATAKTGRLLCLLFLWFGEVSTNAGGELHLLRVILIEKHQNCRGRAQSRWALFI
jgi:hypothetical protein